MKEIIYPTHLQEPVRNHRVYARGNTLIITPPPPPDIDTPGGGNPPPPPPPPPPPDPTPSDPPPVIDPPPTLLRRTVDTNKYDYDLSLYINYAYANLDFDSVTLSSTTMSDLVGNQLRAIADSMPPYDVSKSAGYVRTTGTSTYFDVSLLTGGTASVLYSNESPTDYLSTFDRTCRELMDSRSTVRNEPLRFTYGKAVTWVGTVNGKEEPKKTIRYASTVSSDFRVNKLLINEVTGLIRGRVISGLPASANSSVTIQLVSEWDETKNKYGILTLAVQDPGMQWSKDYYLGIACERLVRNGESEIYLSAIDKDGYVTLPNGTKTLFNEYLDQQYGMYQYRYDKGIKSNVEIEIIADNDNPLDSYSKQLAGQRIIAYRYIAY